MNLNNTKKFIESNLEHFSDEEKASFLELVVKLLGYGTSLGVESEKLDSCLGKFAESIMSGRDRDRESERQRREEHPDEMTEQRKGIQNGLRSINQIMINVTINAERLTYEVKETIRKLRAMEDFGNNSLDAEPSNDHRIKLQTLERLCEDMEKFSDGEEKMFDEFSNFIHKLICDFLNEATREPRESEDSEMYWVCLREKAMMCQLEFLKMYNHVKITYSTEASMS